MPLTTASSVARRLTAPTLAVTALPPTMDASVVLSIVFHAADPATDKPPVLLGRTVDVATAAVSPMPRAETLADSFACRDMPVSGPFPLAVTDDFWSIWAFTEFDTVLTAIPTPSANDVAPLS